MYGYGGRSSSSSSCSNDRVELIHAVDSLKTLKPSDGFLPSKMSRQPIRVVQPPTQQPPSTQAGRQKTYQSPSTTSTRYEDLVQVAEQQKRLIDANRQMIQEREALGNHVDNAPMRLAVLRNEVLFEEREMARLKMMEREAKETAARRVIAERQLKELQMNYTSQEQHLRGVISKITSLQAQLDVLRRRRLVALNAAREQQHKLMSSHIRPPQTATTQSLPGASSITSSSTTASDSNIILRNDNSGLKSSILANQRSASVASSIKQQDLPDCDTGVLRRIPALPDSGRSKCTPFDLPYRPRASVEPFQMNRPKPLADTGRELTQSCPPQMQTKQLGVTTFGKDRASFNAMEHIVVDRNISPSPPKDPYPTAENASDNEMTELEERKFTSVGQPSGKSLPIPVKVTKKQPQLQQQQKSMVKFGGTMILGDELLVSNLVDNTKLAKADQISIRPDTLRAAKRRSWALQDNTPSDETEYIRKILLDEQKKGRTHLLVGCNISNLFPASNKTATSMNKPEIIEEEEKEVLEDITASPTEYACELLMKDIQLDELPIEIVQQVEEPMREKVVVTKEEATEELAEEVEVCNKTSGIAEPVKPAPEKGILRTNKAKNTSRKVVFDPLALLLDAALEGEMDLVKASAAKLPDISACNDEGITALHNAICAGHYEIVRYLVDSFADVNAQDSDGWTPLHCAASCNNLPMVKLLVENGACIFAQTLSDLETPAEKCEEDEDGYEGCQLYLKAADQGAGIVNDGIMYAAYDYDKEQEDELSFRAGTRLRVLEKGVDGKAWWYCETIATNMAIPERGLVPRNYISLYPSLSKRSIDFKMFDLPQVPKFHDIKEVEEEIHERQRSNSLDETGNNSTSHEGAVVEQPLPIPVS